jgi:subtilisin family serine protease
MYSARDTAVLGVGAIQSNDIRFPYSQYQAGVLDLMAPSGAQTPTSLEFSCYSTFYTVDRIAISGFSPDFEPICFPSQDNDYLFSFWGTSASTPQVAAVAALVLSKDSTLTRVQVMKLLKNSAVKSLAWGTIPPDSTPYYGAGRVNAARALSAFYKGDCNLSGTIHVVDLTHLTSFLFSGGPEPYPEKVYGDADCSWSTNVADVTYLVNYLFSGGPAPAKPCIGL